MRWNGGDLRLTIAHLQGITITREQLPYTLTANFEDNIARPKSPIEAALVERGRMDVQSCGG